MPYLDRAKPGLVGIVRACPRCESEKPLSEFGTRKRRGRDVPQSYCRDCMVLYHAGWRRTDEGHAKFRAKQSASRARYPERQRARDLLRRAVAKGEILPGPCENAGGSCRGGIEGHHDDYSKPLEVRWVCRRHHRILDRERQARDAGPDKTHLYRPSIGVQPSLAASGFLATNSVTSWPAVAPRDETP